jgi:hypothetical protein
MVVWERLSAQTIEEQASISASVRGFGNKTKSVGELLKGFREQASGSFSESID